jgi:hypothetical protein
MIFPRAVSRSRIKASYLNQNEISDQKVGCGEYRKEYGDNESPHSKASPQFIAILPLVSGQAHRICARRHRRYRRGTEN